MSLSATDLRAIQAGQAAINRRRAEFGYMANGSRHNPARPQPPQVKQDLQCLQGEQSTQSTQPPGRLRATTKPTPTEYPETVAIYALMGVEAARYGSGTGGAWRLYVMAKALDGHNREAVGWIDLDHLRAFALYLGVNPRTWCRWYEEAVKIGLLDPVQTKGGAWRLLLPSPGKAAFYMGAGHIGRKARMSAADLVGKGWKARVWAAFEAARGLQISRDQLEKISGVPTSTQRYRDDQAGVKRTANYAQSHYRAEHLPGLQEFTNHKGLFLANNGRVYWRLPDTRASDIATDAGKGRGRKAQAELNTLQEQEQSGASKERRALSDDLASSGYVRILCNTPAQRRASERKVSKQDYDSVREVYQRIYENKTSGSGIWDVYEQM